jgi:IS30 family transposase
MARSYVHLDTQERALIEAQLQLGMRPAAIAAGLMRARSTVIREIRRNGWHSPPELVRRDTRIAGGYRCVAADRRARVLRRKPRVVRKLVPGNPLWLTVVDHLRQGLSPAQIASTLARMPDPVRLSYETIYTALYTMPRGHLRSSLLALMRRRHRARRPRRGKDGRAKPSIPDMTLIDQRPIEIQMRLIPGHWEGDLIIGKGNLSQVGTLVERTTLFVALVKLTSTKADITAQAFTEILNRFDSQLRRSMTFDQGSEMRHHKTLTANTGVDVYFAHPHAPWERGISENTNGLLRQYLPKGTDLSLFSQDQLDDIAWRLTAISHKDRFVGEVWCAGCG